MPWFRRKKSDGAEHHAKVGLGLDEAIDGLRADLINAMRRTAGQAVQFPLDKVAVELNVVATRSVDGKARFKVPIVEVELGGEGRRVHETSQKVTVEFGSPVNQDGQPVKVAASSYDPLNG